MKDTKTELDVLRGVGAIAKATNIPERAIYRMLEKNELPTAKKVNGRWCVSRRKLVEFFEGEAA